MNRPLLLVVPLLFAAVISYSQEVPVPEVVALLKEDPDRCAVNMHVYEFDPIVSDNKQQRLLHGAGPAESAKNNKIPLWVFI